jgi:crotonobetainyl-CoA:carnitine CoA-transferase CaiB-like acyl-CoA transferase
VDEAIAAWTRTLPAGTVLERLLAARVPAGPINSAADMLDDPQFRARGLFEEVEVGGRPLKLPAFGPKLSATPGRTEWPGGALGAHTDEVLGGFLGLDEADLSRLRSDGVV